MINLSPHSIILLKNNNYNELTAEGQRQEKRANLIKEKTITKCISSQYYISTDIFGWRLRLLGIEITYFCIWKGTGTCQIKINYRFFRNFSLGSSYCEIKAFLDWRTDWSSVHVWRSSKPLVIYSWLIRWNYHCSAFLWFADNG